MGSPDRREDNRRMVKNSLLLYFRLMIVMAANLYAARLILKGLGVDDFGLYSVVGGIVAMFSFLNGALGAATSRFLTFELGRGDFERLGRIFSAAAVSHAAIAAIVVIFSETVGLWFFFNKMTIPPDRLSAAFWVFQISILTSVFSITQVPYNSLIIAYERMGVYAYVGMFEAAAKLAVSFLIFYAPFDRMVFYALLVMGVQVCIILFYRFYCVRRHPESRIRLHREWGMYGGMLSYTGSNLIANLASMIQGQGLNLLLNVFFGGAVNAARSIAYQAQGAVAQFSGNFMTAVWAQIIKCYARGDLSAMRSLVRSSSCFGGYMMFFIILPLWFQAEAVLRLWLGEYPEYTPSFLRLVLVLCLIQAIRGPRTAVFHAMGKLFWVNVIGGLILCSVFPVGYALLKAGYGPESVFWAANATFLAFEFAGAAILKKYLDFSVTRYLLAVHFRCLCVGVCSYAAAWAVGAAEDRGLFGIAYACAVSALAVCAFSLTIGMDAGMRRSVFAFVRDSAGKILARLRPRKT